MKKQVRYLMNKVVYKSTGGRSGNKEGVGQNGIYGQYSGEVKDAILVLVM